MKKSVRTSFFFLVALCLCWGLSSSISSAAMDARIVDFFITNNAKDVLVYFRVKDCFTKKMDEAILAGIPTTFTFLIEIYQERSGWFNTLLARQEVRHTIKYDNVRNVFFVAYSEQGGLPVEFRSFESAKRAMSDLNGIGVVPMRSLTRESQYSVRVKAKLAKVRMPLHMEYILFFVSMWDFETEWYQQEFVYK